MVHNSKAKVNTLKRLVEAASGLPLGQRPWEVSDVKRDDTVFIRFRSCETDAAITITERVRDVLNAQGYDFTQVDDKALRLPLNQF
jgi:hypothetical protein